MAPQTRRAALVLGASAFAPLAAPALAQAWPTRPIRIIVPFGTGGGTDVSMRIIGPKLAEILGQPVVIENRAGAGGTVGTDLVAKSPPNGEVFVLATLSTVALAIGLYGDRLPYDPLKDLVPVAPTLFIPIALGVSARLGVRTAAEFVATLKANPGRYQFGSSGNGISGHIAGASFLTLTGTEALHVPYRGGGQVFADLVAGNIQFCFDIPSLLAPHHQSGAIRCLFVATDDRSPLLPEVPTAAEAGLAAYKSYSWYGLFGPAGTPRPIVDRLNAAVEQVLTDAGMARRFAEMGTPPMAGYSPDRFAEYLRSEIALWVPLVRATGARAE